MFARNSSVLRVLYTTHYDILEADIDNNFTKQLGSKTIGSGLSDPTEVFYSLSSNYLIYEMIGFLYVQQLDANKPIAVNLKTNQRLPNLKANSYLNIDWIHDHLYWVKDKKQILVSHVTRVHKPLVLANKLYDYITCLAVNPIDSLVVWVEFDSELDEHILYKSFLDGSDRDSIFTFQTHIKRMEFDFQSRRLYYLSIFELCSISYDGTDRQIIASESHSIFQFQVIDRTLYWIEYNSNQLFRSNVADFKTQAVLTLNHTINRFEIVDRLRQPNGIDRCFRSNCSDVCLPIDNQYYKCVCHQMKVCTDNLDLQLAFNHHSSDITATTLQSTTTKTMISSPEKSLSTESQTSSRLSLDKITRDPIEQIDSISFNQRSTQSNNQPIRHVFTIRGKADNETLFFKTQLISKAAKEVSEDIRLGSNVHFELDEEFFQSETKGSARSESTRPISGGEPTQPSADEKAKNESDPIDSEYNPIQTTTTNKIPKLLTLNAITSTELTLEEKNFTETIAIDFEVKQYDYLYIPKYLHKPLMYGFSILLVGLLIGTVLSSLAIKVYGKHKWFAFRLIAERLD